MFGTSDTTTPEKPGSRGLFARLKGALGLGRSSLGRELRTFLGARKIDQQVMDGLEERLLRADVGVQATTEILGELSGRVARHELTDVEALLAALRGRLVELLRPCERPLTIDPQARPFVVLVVGVNGSGKTTTIGKLARQLTASGRKVMLAAGDTFRAAAVEQLSVWADRSSALFSAQTSGADPGAVVFDALQSARSHGADVLLADTAGRLHSQSNLMEELRKIKRVLQRIDPAAPHEVLLVLDANQGQNALAQAEQFHAALGVTGLAITKLDGTAKGGIIVAIARRLRLPIRFMGMGEQVEDLIEFDAEAFVAALTEADEPAGQAEVVR